MNVDGVSHRTIGWSPDGSVGFIDQIQLPGRFTKASAHTVEEMAVAIRTMQVRGAPLIGVAAAYGLALAMRADPGSLESAAALLIDTRPTAVNLRWAVDGTVAKLAAVPARERFDLAVKLANALADDEVAISEAIAKHGAPLLKGKPGRPVQVMTHCNAGWLATVDWGTALAPIFKAHADGVPVHVWVSETRPRNQGLLTAWELRGMGIPHTVLVDNAAGLLMQRGLVDVVIVGTDRTSANGDVCNKIGTYLKALAAQAHGVPFYAAVPSSSIDWTLTDGVTGTPIEQRSADEVAAGGSAVSNYGFDVTPAHLVTGLITERGVCTPTGLRGLFGK